MAEFRLTVALLLEGHKDAPPEQFVVVWVSFKPKEGAQGRQRSGRSSVTVGMLTRCRSQKGSISVRVVVVRSH